MSKRFIKGKKLTIEEAFYLIEVGEDEMIRKEVGGKLTYTNLIGMQMFKAKGCDCKTCSTKGAFFRIEKTSGPKDKVFCNWHLNLYGYDYLGREVLMTKDHTVPKSQGGPDTLENLEPMCKICNNRKGTKSEEEWNEICDQINKRLSGNNEELVKRESLEKWDKEVKEGDYESMLAQIHFGDSTKLAKFGNIYYHVVTVVSSKRHIGVIYDNRLGDIISVLEKDALDKVPKSIPYWAQGHIEEYKSTRKKLLEDAKKNFKKFKNQKEAVSYYKSYKHPELLFRMWKNIPLNNVLSKLCRKELGL